MKKGEFDGGKSVSGAQARLPASGSFSNKSSNSKKKHLFGNTECPDGDVSSVVRRLKPHVNVVITSV